MAEHATRPREFAFTPHDFTYLAELVTQHTGIRLPPEKKEMLYGRLSRRLRHLGLGSFGDYRALLEGPDGEQEITHTINALTTNLTGFFREAHHFDHLAKVALPQILEAQSQSGTRRLRLWSAGCSTGQEPYSIAMTLLASMPQRNQWDVRILATDLDSQVLQHARAGCYDRGLAEKIPANWRSAYAESHPNGQMRMARSLREIITFNHLNLMHPWPMRGPFSVIFCRNVVIYFDKPTQRILFDRMADLLTPRGYLYIGHSETLFNVCDRFEACGKTIYRKKEDA
ncbi:MAG: protein-glutamate O-methyltransferase CheR [Alphaproteobacteria bacterium]|nr:MAG: protein-glutamate O-methyltransferase CheR [Alphaproteobacteria bacterium]